MDLHDQIYYSLIGQLEEGAALPWIPNAFADGSPCDEAYTRLLTARNRVLEKLGSGDDPDLSRMLLEMDTIQRLLCRALLALPSSGHSEACKASRGNPFSSAL